jgi:peptidoglycan-associated lipoprotein
MRAPPRLHAFLLVAISLGAMAALTACPSKKAKTPACGSNDDCKDGLACIAKQCQKCTGDADCGPGHACQAGACVAKPECSSDDDCGAGKICKAHVCTACGKDADCGPGGKCAAGACQRGKPCKTDDECAEDEDCTGGHCQKGGGTSSEGGSCTLTTIYFAFDQAAIGEGERTNLDADGACLEKEAQKNVYLNGHTDSSGTDEYNIALSERRARTVADYLARLGIDPARLQVVPKGEAEPSGQGDDKDRRVDLQWR